MKHLKIWENFQSENIITKVGFRDRWRNYDLLYYNVWLDGEKIIDALTGPAWSDRRDDMGWLYLVAPVDNPKVAYVVSIAFPLLKKGIGLSEKIYQNLANELNRQIRNPKEDQVLTQFFNTTSNSDRYWELRRDKPFFPDNQIEEDGEKIEQNIR